ncbi:hypothetical protein ASG54_18910 [Aureimonas sp. Leaf460]|nr:hypothetical protein ASG54_18910 [Aureimonas sp. Leaf460]
MQVLRVEGVLDAQTYRGFEAFLFNSMDRVVGLDIRVEIAEDTGPGSIEAGVSPDGKFVAYLVDGKDSEIVAQEGFVRSRGSVIFDGYFVVKSGGLHQGIESLFLDKIEEASVLLSKQPIKTIEIARLNPKIRKP